MEKKDTNRILSSQDISQEKLEKLIETASILERSFQSGKRVSLLNGKIIAILFFEPSTRTRFSFESSVLRLGGQVLSLESGVASSIEKGESYSDMGNIISGYCDAIAIRHSSSQAIRDFASGCNVPVINAGDGANEHPTQALLDMFTIYKEKGCFDNLKIGLVGDLRYGRTIHSLVCFLKYYKNSIYFISPENLRLPNEIKQDLVESGCQIHELSSLDNIVDELDVIYSTRMQKERMEQPHALYNLKKDSYEINLNIVSKMKSDAIILHPLPRVDEISQEVDKDKRACYFKQAQNGLYMRMSLLCELLSDTKILYDNS
tara:strand:- start:1201 stop:2154 length:954 start_codon:yes stop_codon:yes gene_type:complete